MQIAIENIINALGTGAENRITQKKLCEKLGCTPADLKDSIKKYRRNSSDADNFIVSGSRGYYLAKDEQEKQEFYIMMSKQISARVDTLRLCKEHFQNKGRTKYACNTCIGDEHNGK